MIPELLKECEVAQILGRSVATVARLRKAGQLDYLPGRPILIDRVDLERYMRDQQDRKKAKAEARRSPPLSPRAWAEQAVLLQRRK